MEWQERFTNGQKSKLLSLLRNLLALTIFMVAPTMAATIEYDSQLCSAELIIIQADIKKLDSASTPQIQQIGLQKRIKGAFSTLNWLCRRNAAFNNTKAQAIKLLEIFNSGKRIDLNQQLKTLIQKMPLSLTGLQAKDATAQDIKIGKQLYQQYCRACHISQNHAVELPAFSLITMAKKLAPAEFIARMLAGVKGTPAIALHNPLSKADIAGIYAYLLKAKN